MDPACGLCLHKLLMLPYVSCFVSRPQASIPAANGHFSARALARFYAAIAKDALRMQSSNAVVKQAGGLFAESGWAADFLGEGAMAKASLAQGEQMVQGGAGRFSHGYMLFPPIDNGATSTGRTTAFGHAGLGGSVALGDAAHGVAVAITLNRLGWDTAGTTGRILRAVYHGLGLPIPAAYADTIVASSEAKAEAASN